MGIIDEKINDYSFKSIDLLTLNLGFLIGALSFASGNDLSAGTYELVERSTFLGMIYGGYGIFTKKDYALGIKTGTIYGVGYALSELFMLT